MVTESPAVSPRVVAAILMIQNHKVTSGTLPKVSSLRKFIGLSFSFVFLAIAMPMIAHFSIAVSRFNVLADSVSG